MIPIDETISESAEKLDGEQALKIKEPTCDNIDLVSLDVRYHGFCQTMLQQVPIIEILRGNIKHSTIDEDMELPFSFE